MSASFSKLLPLGALLLWALECQAQTNVYSLSVRTRWAVGSYPLRFGLEGYRKDAAGYYVLASDGTSVRDGTVPQKVRDHTCVIFGPVAFTVPLPPWTVAVLWMGALSGATVGAVAMIHRARRNTNEKQDGP